MMPFTKKTVGRYAPSPTGELHLGNLRTALLAWLHARLLGGEFKLRMDDLDQPRVVVGSADQILRDLEGFGLDWDGKVLYQSQRSHDYQQELQQLSDLGLIYECFCSRKDIQQAASAPHLSSAVYPGFCANLDEVTRASKRIKKTPAMRVRVDDREIVYVDGFVGEWRQRLTDTCGDFVVKRADGLFAYQLATVVDDIFQEVTDVVRGSDLVESTTRQIYLFEKLSADIVTPRYWHVPLMLDENGDRLAKRDGALSISDWRAKGQSVEQLIGYLAHSVGLIARAEAISAQELLAELSFDVWYKRVAQSTLMQNNSR